LSQINFNKKIVTCFSKDSPVTELELYKVNLIGAINSLTSLVSEELPSYKLMSIEALLTLDVHSRDILASLITQKVIIICLSFLNFKSNVSK
jgi:hypothetical protein